MLIFAGKLGKPVVRKSYNLFFLVFFLLVVFGTPLVVKDLHFHSISDIPITPNRHQKILYKSPKSCVICQFEIRNVIADNVSGFLFINHEGVFRFIPPEKHEFKTGFVFFSHRAPPSGNIS